MSDPRKPSLREEQDRLCPPHWAELLGLLAMMTVFVIALLMNVPEPLDCGVDRDAPTLEEGCPV